MPRPNEQHEHDWQPAEPSVYIAGDKFICATCGAVEYRTVFAPGEADAAP